MMRLLGALLVTPVSAAMGTVSAITEVFREKAPARVQAETPFVEVDRPAHPAVPSVIVPPIPELPGDWSDLPLPPDPASEKASPPQSPAVAAAALSAAPPTPSLSPQFSETSKPTGRKWTMDQDLNDDMNKLVRFSIICVDREHETVLQKLEETMVRDRLDENGFTAWKILEFVQKMAAGEVEAPSAWRHPGTRPGGVEIRSGRLVKIDGEAMKYLRVPFQIVARFPRERFKYEEKQIEVLRQIEKDLAHRDGGSSSSGDTSTAGGVAVSAPPAGQELVIEVKPQ